MKEGLSKVNEHLGRVGGQGAEDEEDGGRTEVRDSLDTLKEEMLTRLSSIQTELTDQMRPLREVINNRDTASLDQ